MGENGKRGKGVRGTGNADGKAKGKIEEKNRKRERQK